MKVEKTDQPEKIRTCGINCAVCDKHVQKSYSCCTLQTAPEKFKHLFKPGVHRLKICRKCIPYKKVVKVENQVVKKNPGKIKQKRGRKPRSEKHGGATVKTIHSGTVGSQQGIVKSGLNDVLISTFTAKPFASVMDHKEKEMLNISEGTVNCDRNRIMSMKMESNHKNMNNIAQNRENVHFLQSQPEQSLKVNEIPVGVSIN